MWTVYHLSTKHLTIFWFGHGNAQVDVLQSAERVLVLPERLLLLPGGLLPLPGRLLLSPSERLDHEFPAEATVCLMLLDVDTPSALELSLVYR